MQKMSTLIDQLRSTTLESEDGEPLSLDVNCGLSRSQIDQYEEALGFKLPRGLREVLECFDGGEFYCLSFQSIDEQMLLGDDNLLSFHDWGNGDYDCVLLERKGRWKPGQILFYNHLDANVYPISFDVRRWLELLIGELKAWQTVFHPMDYHHAVSRSDDAIKCDISEGGHNPAGSKDKRLPGPEYLGVYANVSSLMARHRGESDPLDEKMNRAFFASDKRVYRYPSGDIEFVEEYYDGKKHGKTVRYYPEGTLAYETHFQMGKLHGQSTFWDKKGNITLDQVWKDGTEWDGIFPLRDEDNVSYHQIYKEGQLVSKTRV